MGTFSSTFIIRKMILVLKALKILPRCFLSFYHRKNKADQLHSIISYRAIPSHLSLSILYSILHFAQHIPKLPLKSLIFNYHELEYVTKRMASASALYLF